MPTPQKVGGTRALVNIQHFRALEVHTTGARAKAVFDGDNLNCSSFPKGSYYLFLMVVDGY